MSRAERISCLQSALALADAIASHPWTHHELWMRAKVLSLHCRATLRDLGAL